MIKNFRFNTPWEQFEEAVKVLKDLIKQKEAYWLLGCLRGFDLFIDDNIAESLDKEILRIIYSEIMYLLYGAINGEDIDEEKMKKAILRESSETSEEDAQAAAMSVRNKFELVKDSFDFEQLRRRYKLKKESIHFKLSDFAYNICSSDLSDGEKINCAFINITAQKRLTDMEDKDKTVPNSERQQEVYFVCDYEDIDMLIHQLEHVKKQMGEH